MSKTMAISSKQSTGIVVILIIAIVMVVVVNFVSNKIKQAKNRRNVDEDQLHFDTTYYWGLAQSLDDETAGFNVTRPSFHILLQNISDLNNEELKIVSNQFGVKQGDTMKKRLRNEWIRLFSNSWFIRNTIVERLAGMGIA